MSVYVTLPTFKDYCRNQLPTADDVHLQSALDAAEESINEMCQRTFIVAGAATARSFGIPINESLSIADATTVTSVTVGGTALDPTTYRLEPIGAVGQSDNTGLVTPYTGITNLAYYWPPTVLGVVVVTATWGWLATPPKVIEATKILARNIAEKREDRLLSNLNAEDDVAQMLARLRRREVWGIA